MRRQNQSTTMRTTRNRWGFKARGGETEEVGGYAGIVKTLATILADKLDEPAEVVTTKRNYGASEQNATRLKMIQHIVRRWELGENNLDGLMMISR